MQTIVKQKPFRKNESARRNSKCLCGSERKWKKCCGILFTDTLNGKIKMEEILNNLRKCPELARINFVVFLNHLRNTGKIYVLWDWLDTNGLQSLTRPLLEVIISLSLYYQDDERCKIWVNEIQRILNK